MFKTLKQHFRILPMVIFMATLMLSVRINNLFDMLKNPAADRFSISQSLAAAEEKNNKETADLNKLLEASDSVGSDTPAGTPTPNSGFTQSEIMILQELAERREALDIRSREIDKKAVQLKVADGQAIVGPGQVFAHRRHAVLVRADGGHAIAHQHPAQAGIGGLGPDVD